MLKYVDDCVSCPPELGCLGNSCPKKNIPVYYCDICEEEMADYHVDGQDICEDCLNEHIEADWKRRTKQDKLNVLSKKVLDEDYLDEIFEDLNTKEKCETLGIELNGLG